MLSTHANKSYYTWDHFKAEFGVKEDSTRRAIFTQNLQKIHQHNAMGTRRSWQMGVNKFAALTSEEFKAHYRGFNADVSSFPLADLADMSSHVAVEDLPAAVDWR